CVSEFVMPPARPFWKGYLKLSLVSCPIAVYPASSSSERVSFRQINKKTGNRLKQQLVDSVTGEVVESTDKGRGYQIGKEEYLPVEEEELEVLRLESTHTIDIEKFVPRSEIDERYLDSPYYLTPEDKVGQDAFAVIREAMARKKMVGLGRVVISRRERIVMLEPRDKGLVATTLQYAYEIRNASEYFDEIPDMQLPSEMVELAEHILDTKAGHFDPSEFEDRYENAVVDLLKRKQAGMPIERSPKPRRPATSSTSWTRCGDPLRPRSQLRRRSQPSARSPPEARNADPRRGRGRRDKWETIWDQDMPEPLNVVVDISHHNGNVNLAKAKADGILGVIQKATQGQSFKDPTYQRNRQKAKDAGVLWGAYHFGSGSDGLMQAQHFLDVVGNDPGTLLVLDFEPNPTGPSMDLEEARAFVTHINEERGRF